MLLNRFDFRNNGAEVFVRFFLEERSPPDPEVSSAGCRPLSCLLYLIIAQGIFGETEAVAAHACANHCVAGPLRTRGSGNAYRRRLSGNRSVRPLSDNKGRLMNYRLQLRNRPRNHPGRRQEAGVHHLDVKCVDRHLGFQSCLAQQGKLPGKRWFRFRLKRLNLIAS